MSRGVYIVANDRVADQAIGLLSSLRQHDVDIPVFMIPFNDQYEIVFSRLSQHYNVQLFPDLDFLERFTQIIADVFPRDFLKLPNKMRKLVAWFGPLEEFIYIDTDILVFQPLEDAFRYLQKADFMCCDFHYKGRGLSDVFSSVMVEKSIFSSKQLDDVFNSGFWGSHKRVFSLESMTHLLKECAAHREYFDFSSGTTDQPIMNYLILKGTTERINIVRENPEEPGSWGGSAHFREIDHVLYDGDRKLRYLHWAGTAMRPGGPYWDVWEHYRFLDVKEPLFNLKSPKAPTFWQRIRKQLHHR